MKGLAGLIALGSGAMLSPQEKAFYESLLASENPWVQLLASRQLLRSDASKFFLSMIEIFSTKLAGDPGIWNMDNVEFIPGLLRSAIHRLAVSDREALLTHAQPFYQTILKKGNLRHLLAWQSRDVFWPYINILALNHRDEEARRVVEQAIAVLESGKTNPGGKKGR